MSSYRYPHFYLRRTTHGLLMIRAAAAILPLFGDNADLALHVFRIDVVIGKISGVCTERWRLIDPFVREKLPGFSEGVIHRRRLRLLRH